MTRVIVALTVLVAILCYAPAIADDAVTRGGVSYKQYCAACHGYDGKGAGPAAPAMKVPPTDLTMLQKKGESFPKIQVMSSIRGEEVMAAAHGSREMPVWGDYFRKTEKGREEARILSLMLFLESIQINK